MADAPPHHTHAQPQQQQPLSRQAGRVRPRPTSSQVAPATLRPAHAPGTPANTPLSAGGPALATMPSPVPDLMRRKSASAGPSTAGTTLAPPPGVALAAAVSAPLRLQTIGLASASGVPAPGVPPHISASSGVSPRSARPVPILKLPGQPKYLRHAYRTRRNTHYIPLSTEPDDTPLYGYMLLLATYTCFVVTMYSAVVSKLMPATGNRFLDWIRDDEFYCYFIPLLGPVATFFVLWNWMGMKFFRHA